MPLLGLGLGLGFGGRKRTRYVAGTVLISDQFIEASNINLQAHTPAPTNMPTASWVTFGATGFTVNATTDKAERISTAIQRNACVVDAEQVPVKVRVGVTDATSIAQAEAGGIIRFQDINNYWIVERQLNSGVNSTVLVEVTAGASTSRASMADNPTTTENWVEVEDNGSSLTIRNQLGNSASYSSTNLNAFTKCGIGRALVQGLSGACTWDDFTVTAT